MPERQTDWFDPELPDSVAETLYEVTPTLEQWKAMQAGEAVEAPKIKVKREQHGEAK